MSYSINGFKTINNSDENLKKFINELKNCCLTHEKFNNDNLLKEILVCYIIGDFKPSDILWDLNPYMGFDYYSNKSSDCDKIKTINQLIEYYYKTAPKESIYVFYHKNYDFLLINNTLTKHKKAFDFLNSPYLKEYSFSTSTGMTNNSRVLYLEDEKFYESITVLHGLNDDFDLEEYLNKFDLFNNIPSVIDYNNVKNTWEEFTEKSYFINKKGTEFVIYDPSNNKDFSFKNKYVSDVIGLINEEQDVYQIGQKYLIDKILKEDFYKEKLNNIKMPNEYIKIVNSIKRMDDFKDNALIEGKKVLKDFEQKFKTIKISDFLEEIIF